MRYKYPRTPHLPWSEGVSSDDEKLIKLHHFIDQDIVVTEKLDGENTTLYADYMHARSIDSINHPSREWVKRLHAQIAYKIPESWRLCGENLFAKHSLHYHNLESYFFLFAIFDKDNICLSFEDTQLYALDFGIAVPKILYQGPFNEDIIRNLKIDTQHQEGYVLRNKKAFAYNQFNLNVAKWVRKNHVEQTTHWMSGPVVQNKLKV
jgi:RNA ligase